MKLPKQYYIFILSICLLDRAQGGLEAEKAERDRWATHERKKITDSVDGEFSYKIVLCDFVFVLSYSTLLYTE